jgi:hypothetical protein
MTTTYPTLMYVGDNITALGLRHGAVYRGGIPRNVQPFLADCPALGALFVGAGLPATKARLERFRAGSPTYQFISIVKAWVKRKTGR